MEDTYPVEGMPLGEVFSNEEEEEDSRETSVKLSVTCVIKRDI